MKRKRQTITVAISQIEVSTAWGASKLTVDDNCARKAKRAIIVIERPSDIVYLREHLNKIEAFWRAELDTLKR